MSSYDSGGGYSQQGGGYGQEGGGYGGGGGRQEQSEYGGGGGGYGGGRQEQSGYGGGGGGYGGGGGGYGGGQGGSNDEYLGGAMHHAQQHAGGDGDSSMFQNSINHMQNNRHEYGNQGFDENEAVNAHQSVYGQGGQGGNHSSQAVGMGGAMQVFVCIFLF